MRAVLLALVSFSAACGPAVAASQSCPETKAIVAAYVGEFAGADNTPAQPALIGQEFKVTGRAPGRSRRTQVVSLSNKVMSLALQEEWSPKTTGTLYTSRKARSASMRASISPKVVKVGDIYSTTISTGPLKGLSLTVKDCR